MDIQKAREIHETCNAWFYGFDSNMSISIDNKTCYVKYQGCIYDELCRINVAMFIVEMIENVKPSCMEFDYSGLEINSDDFIELIIEIAFVLNANNIDHFMYISDDITNNEIFKEFSSLFDYKYNTDRLILNGERIETYSIEHNISPKKIFKNWQDEFMVSTMNTELPGISYKYHTTII
jgi:hypothetical protein